MLGMSMMKSTLDSETNTHPKVRCALNYISPFTRLISIQNFQSTTMENLTPPNTQVRPCSFHTYHRSLPYWSMTECVGCLF